MATNCGSCENSDYEDPKCCPDSIASGHAVDVRDRNCVVKRILPTPGLFGVANGKFKQLTGSDESPIKGMEISEVDSADGVVLIQTPEGRVLAITPVEGTSEAQVFGLVYQDSVLKFAPINKNVPYFVDADLASSTTGIIPVFGCTGDGLLSIGKLLPGCTGNRYLVIAENGNVSCDTRETDDCVGETAEDGIIDYILGCKDGKLAKIAPEEGMILQFNEDKWEMKPNASEEVWVGGPFIYQNDYTSISSPVFGPIAIPFGPSVPNTAKWVQIRIQTHWLTGTTVAVSIMKLNGTPVITTVAGSGGGHQGSAHVYIPYGDGTFTLESELVVATAGNTYADGGTSAGILSYR